MIYEPILRLAFDEAKFELPGRTFCISSINHLGLVGSSEIQSVSNNSELLVIYNLTNNTMLVLSERFDSSDVSIECVFKVVEEFNCENQQYFATVNIGVEGKYTEVVVCTRQIWESV